MIYKYDKNQLIYKKDTKTIKVFALICIKLAIVAFIIGRYARIDALDDYEKQLIVLDVGAEHSKFTEEKLIAVLNDLNIKFPHIVLAQAMVETGHFNSNIFKQNNNLFGMKEARTRIHTASGTQFGHAYYDTWLESVYDYAFYQCRYLSGIRSEEEYFAYLGKSYAEADDYVSLLKRTIRDNDLKQHFD